MVRHPHRKIPERESHCLAAESLAETFRRENDVKNMEVWAEKIATAGLGRDFDEKIRTMKVGALFRSAETLFQAGRTRRRLRNTSDSFRKTQRISMLTRRS